MAMRAIVISGVDHIALENEKGVTATEKNCRLPIHAAVTGPIYSFTLPKSA